MGMSLCVLTSCSCSGGCRVYRGGHEEWVRGINRDRTPAVLLLRFYSGSRYQVCVTADAGPVAIGRAGSWVRRRRPAARPESRATGRNAPPRVSAVARAHAASATNFNGVSTWSKCFTLLG